MATHKALGKGLSALIPETEDFGTGAVRFFQCPIEMIEPNPYQPRQTFEGEELEELAGSVKEQGILTPPHCRRAPLAGRSEGRARQGACGGAGDDACSIAGAGFD